MPYLIWGLATLAVLVVSVPLVIMRATAIVADMLSKSEVEDVET